MEGFNKSLFKDFSLQDLIDSTEFEFKFIHSSGPGGQNVNKVATAVQLRFNIRSSRSLPSSLQEKLLTNLSQKLTKKGEILIHSQKFRSQAQNKQAAIQRLFKILQNALKSPKKRILTQLSLANKAQRLDVKKRRSKVKKQRNPVKLED